MVELNRIYVPAGTFQIIKRKKLILQAFLGTCVGLALYCRNTGIGGIIHLLLPEPISTQGTTQPEKYATSGVPLFVEKILEAGAQREGLVACLAGGALVGPLSKQDLDLDIGGRTTEKVKEILTDQGIDIIKSETGGFFTCCLSLNMLNGECTIEPAGYSKLSETVQVRPPSAAEIKQAMDRLKPIPQVALKVLRLIDRQDYAIETLADEIRQDQVITARTLQLANSALYGSKRAIESLDHALVYLGQDLLVKLVISAAVQSYFDQGGMGYSLCKGGIYHHAIGCAQVAEVLARKTGKVEPAKAYTAGLLHDIGKVVLDQYVTSAYPLFYRKVMDDEENVMAIEHRLLGIDHTEVGRLLAQQWSFPASLTEVIRYHHEPNKAAAHPHLTLIVYLADLLLSRFNIGIEIERLDTQTLAKYMQALDLTTSQFADLVDLIPPAVFAATEAQQAMRAG